MINWQPVLVERGPPKTNLLVSRVLPEQYAEDQLLGFGQQELLLKELMCDRALL